MVQEQQTGKTVPMLQQHGVSNQELSHHNNDHAFLSTKQMVQDPPKQ